MKVLRRTSPGPVSLAKRGLGDHAGQVVHKVVHEVIPGAAPRPTPGMLGGRPLLIVRVRREFPTMLL